MEINILAKIEALIFTSEKPVSLEKLTKALALTKSDLKEYIKVLKNEYGKRSHGIMLKDYDNSYLFVTKPEYGQMIQKIVNRDQSIHLSQAALETLAIIAYRQPVTRAEIEEIRGVKAEKTLFTLSKYELIQELGRKDTIGNPIVYGTTDNFLRHFDLKDLSQLPMLINE